MNTPHSSSGDSPPFRRIGADCFEATGQLSAEIIIQQASTLLSDQLKTGEVITSPKSAVKFLQMSLAGEPNEHFAALFLNTKHIVIDYQRLFSGTVNGASVHPRVVVQKALACNAAAVIFAHNHPSGDPEPSRADKRITKDLVDALRLIDVKVLDHFVVSTGGYVSLAEQGWL